MATNDLRSNLKQIVPLRANLTANGVRPSIVFDTAKFDLGIMITSVIAPFTQGTYTFSVLEDDDPGFGSPTLVPDENLIGTPPTLTAQTMQGDVLGTFGVFGTKRFLRIDVLIANVAGDNHMAITVTMAGENLPIDSP